MGDTVTPGVHNITIYKGSDYQITFTLTNSSGTAIDLTGYTAKAQIRQSKGTDATLIEDFTATILSPETNGQVRLSLTDTETDAIEKSRGYYDLMLIDSSDFSTYYVVGEVTFEKGVTSET